MRGLPLLVAMLLTAAAAQPARADLGVREKGEEIAIVTAPVSLVALPALAATTGRLAGSTLDREIRDALDEARVFVRQDGARVAAAFPDPGRPVERADACAAGARLGARFVLLPSVREDKAFLFDGEVAHRSVIFENAHHHETKSVAKLVVTFEVIAAKTCTVEARSSYENFLHEFRHREVPPPALGAMLHAGMALDLRHYLVSLFEIRFPLARAEGADGETLGGAAIGLEDRELYSVHRDGSEVGIAQVVALDEHRGRIELLTGGELRASDLITRTNVWPCCVDLFLDGLSLPVEVDGTPRRAWGLGFDLEIYGPRPRASLIGGVGAEWARAGEGLGLHIVHFDVGYIARLPPRWLRACVQGSFGGVHATRGTVLPDGREEEATLTTLTASLALGLKARMGSWAASVEGGYLRHLGTMREGWTAGDDDVRVSGPDVRGRGLFVRLGLGLHFGL